MRELMRLFAVALCASVVVTVAEAQDRPQFRPAVLGSGPDSLINRIDVDALIKAGQKDGAVMFSSLVSKTGAVVQSRTFRGMPGTALLEEELRKKLADAKFAPAIYNHQPVDVILSGTVIFFSDAKPHVRIFLNQDPNELKAEADFIAPQPVFGGDSGFTGLDYPTEIPVPVSAVVDLGLNVDATGRLRDLRVIAEEPPLLGFAELARRDIGAAKFIPAFRDGDATQSNTVYSVSYQPADWAASLEQQ
ncbi:MAG: hypothetical protein AVDCRST_MAG42-1896 [uncultured Chthoniobacterales bacterium]|uniref:TonB C-terminal domain-containing protein n=1 Tax=uncultured Chthoniobacterales bacterium TaxID=1836801 RepID=A0A6J4I784_9BACT|nr:MAG: hypothetical protein AVDCRST_MAG42-1896 [uncultured Chthoniobacterales bacterium]